MEADHLAGLSVAKYRAGLETTSLSHATPPPGAPAGAAGIQGRALSPSERWVLPDTLSWPHCWQLPAGAETNLEHGKAKSAFRESWAQGDSEVLGQENQGRPGTRLGHEATKKGK